MTTTLKLTADEIRDLRTTLEREGFDFRSLDYAHFQARSDGLIVSAYKSGKVVFQGKRAGDFLARHGLAEETATGGLDVPTAGSDESGKGDYFGPLVVAAVVVTPEQTAALAHAGVRDCKQMTDPSILRAAAGIRTLCAHAVVALSPEEYNAAHAAEGNVALFLSRMHAEAIARAIGDAEACERIVIDQFTFAERLESALHAEGVDLPVEIRPRAEDNPAVAAASVLARAEFLIGMRDLGNEFGVELPKGAGAPVDRAARKLFREGGMAALSALAKVHFKTTKRITEHLF